MPLKALITGATGFLGRAVVKAFEDSGAFETTSAGFSRAAPPKVVKLDLTDAEDVERVLEVVKPDVVVHCAANRQPNSCTADPEAARHLNVTATANLARFTHERGIFLIYISTDYVFSGKEGQAPYSIADEPAPTNYYGQTKLDGEKAVLEATSSSTSDRAVSAVVLRVPVLYGTTDPIDNHGESAVNILMDVLWKSQGLKEGDEKIKMDDWAIRYPTNTADVARVCVDVSNIYLSQSKSTSTSQSGSEALPQILQFSSEDRMTKHEIIMLFGSIMDLPTNGIVAEKDGGKPAPDGTMRPYDCHLSTDALKNIGVDTTTVGFEPWWRRQVGAFRH